VSLAFSCSAHVVLVHPGLQLENKMATQKDMKKKGGEKKRKAVLLTAY
jgi:hypothetical protein